MNVEMNYNLSDIVHELEVALQIDGKDFEEKDMDILIRNVRMRIENQYALDLTSYKLSDVELQIEPYRPRTAILLDNITCIHSKLCGFFQIARYLTRLDVSLDSINYLGFEEEGLKLVLEKLQRKSTMKEADEALRAIKNKLQTISSCMEKRLFVLLVVSHDLGLDEVVAAIAEILYMAARR